MFVVKSLCLLHKGYSGGSGWQLIKSHRSPPDAFQAGGPMRKCSEVDREAPAGDTGERTAPGEAGLAGAGGQGSPINRMAVRGFAPDFYTITLGPS